MTNPWETPHQEVLVLGIGNILWADEGFGPRSVEAFNARYRVPEGVLVVDGGTLGMYLSDLLTHAKRLLVVDCVDFKAEPGFMKVLYQQDLKVWQTTKISPHQTGFNDLLATCMILGHKFDEIAVVGVQPDKLDDYGGSLSPTLEPLVEPAIKSMADILTAWGFAPTLREPGEEVEPLMDSSLSRTRYESERPEETEACRAGDERFMKRARGVEAHDPNVPPMRK